MLRPVGLQGSTASKRWSSCLQLSSLLGVLFLLSSAELATAASGTAASNDTSHAPPASVGRDATTGAQATTTGTASLAPTGRATTAAAGNGSSISAAARLQPTPVPWWRGQIAVRLTPRGDINVTEGDSREFHCRIYNRPLTAQVRWFYTKKNPHRMGYSNYTILANEYLTINPEWLQSTYVEPATYILTVKHFSLTDSGDYTCFFQASPNEIHRDTVHVNVLAKTLPEPTTAVMPTTTAPGDRGGHAEHSAMPTTAQPQQHTIQRAKPSPAAEQLPTPLPRGTTMPPTNFKQRSTLPLQPLTKRKAKTGSEPGASSPLPPSPSSAEEEPTAAEPAGAPSTGGGAEGSRPSLKKSLPTPVSSASGSRCDYHIIVHEVDESSCPKAVGAAQQHYLRAPAVAGATGRYQADDVHGDYMDEARPPPTQYRTGAASVAAPALLLSERVDKLEDRLIAEMVKQQMANHTMTAYESALREAERLVAEQGHNVTRLDEALRRAEATMERQRAALRSVDEKLAGLMLDVAETNSRLDKAARRTAAGRAVAASAEGKQVPVTSATEASSAAEVVHFKDCDEVYRSGRTTSDVYYIKPLHSARLIPVWCDMDTWPGGWLVLQRRREGTQAFNHNWNGYRHGFGNVSSDFWLGNDNIFLLSNQAEYMLRVDMWDFFDSRVFAEYRTFKVDGERDQYKLSIGNHSGTAKDGLQKHDGVKFSTPDRDNDLWSDYHCALDWNAGWWFTNCWHVLLNGGHGSEPRPKFKGICWIDWKDEQLKATEMKIRPVFHLGPAASPTAASAQALT